MYLRKTIVLVALAAATAAPSALAMYPPIEGGDPGPTIVQREPGVHPRVKPRKLCGQRELQVYPRCFARIS